MASHLRYNDCRWFKHGRLNRVQKWQPDAAMDEHKPNPSESGRTNFWGGYTNTQESGRFYMGMCRWYTTALTAAQVAHNYNLEKADYGY